MSKSSLEFINTDVLISSYNTSDPNQDQARDLLVRLWNQRTGCLSVPVLQRFYLAVTRGVPNPMSVETAMSLVADFAVWKVYSPSAADIIEAAGIQEQYHIDFEQAMILVSADKMKCSVIWTDELTIQKYKDIILIKPIKEVDNT